METQPTTTAPVPPKLIQSLIAGFNAVANHIWLILFPVALDLYLWLGPHLNLKVIFQPILSQFTVLQNSAQGSQMEEMLQSAQQIYNLLASRLNLMAALRTLPVGVPSLMAGSLPLETPFGLAQTVQVSSFGQTMLWWLALAILGIAVGAIFFYLVSRVALNDTAPQSLKRIFQVVGQVFVLTLAFIILGLIIAIPLLLVTSFLTIISIALAQLFIILLSLAVIWVIVPLFFAPHGIFVNRQQAMPSMVTSARLVRYILPGIGGFLILVLILSQGLDSLWRVPPATSWLTLVGIFGHAFISTGLVSASFIYYRDGLRFVQELLHQQKTTVTTIA